MNTVQRRPDSQHLTTCDKGVPGNVRSMRSQDVAAQGWNVLREDLPLPVAILKSEALAHNRQWMRQFLGAHDVLLAPHGKTSMSPGLFDLQLADGAWAITLATPHQIQVARHFGYSRIFLANQLVGRSAIEFVVAELDADPEFEFYCLVDSVAGVEQLLRVARRVGLKRRICVLVEMGYSGGRTGCRSVDQGLDVARFVAANGDSVQLSGIEGFEGLIRRASAQDTVQEVEGFLSQVVDLARACESESLFAASPIILSAGGSAYFDLVVKLLCQANLNRPFSVILRSGCYLTHDSLMYTVAFEHMKRRSPEVQSIGADLRHVIEVWAYVQSRPEPELAIVGMGKRDVSYDELPVPLTWFQPGSRFPSPMTIPPSHRITRLNDQHGYLSIPADSPLRVGDLIGFGISHPCLTFDKWRVMHVVDANYTVQESIRTYF